MPRWFLWTVATMLSWGVWAVLGKVIGDGLTAAQSQMLSTFGFLPVILALCVSKQQLVRSGRRWGLFYALAAGAVSCLGNLPYYDLLSRGEKAAAVTLREYRERSRRWRAERNDTFESCTWYRDRWTQNRNITMTATGVAQDLGRLQRMLDQWFK